jgi:hypothetical protein
METATSKRTNVLVRRKSVVNRALGVVLNGAINTHHVVAVFIEAVARTFVSASPVRGVDEVKRLVRRRSEKGIREKIMKEHELKRTDLAPSIGGFTADFVGPGSDLFNLTVDIGEEVVGLGKKRQRNRERGKKKTQQKKKHENENGFCEIKTTTKETNRLRGAAIQESYTTTTK